jgi:hypothetical protein
VEIMLPSSHPPLTASQQNLERKRAESQIPARKSGENSRRKLQNVVTDSGAFGHWANARVIGEGGGK